MHRVGGDRRCGFPTFEQQAFELLPVPVVADELGNVGARGLESPLGGLFFDEGPEGRW